jgi:hypothetical protein
MGAIGDLLASDTDNASCCRENLRQLDPAFPEAFDTAAEMFTTFSRCVEGTQDESSDCQILERYGQAHGLTTEEVIGHLGRSDTSQTAPSNVRDAYVGMHNRRAKAVVFLLLQRAYLWGVTDLLRLRLTSAAGYGRLEAEALGLLLLMRDDPTVGDRWLGVRTEHEGRAFFGTTQERLKERLRELDLAVAYDQGSAAAQHVRLLSAVAGLSWSDTQASLAAQETDPEDPFSFFLGALYFLSTQVRVFHALKKAFPEVTDPLWDQRVQLFINDVARLWGRLEERFPRHSAQVQAWTPRGERGSEGDPRPGGHR